MRIKITHDDIKKAVEFSINRVCYNQENSTWARLMIENLLTNSPDIKEPMGYIQGGLILGYTMRYLEMKEKGFKNR